MSCGAMSCRSAATEPGSAEHEADCTCLVAVALPLLSWSCPRFAGKVISRSSEIHFVIDALNLKLSGRSR
jgi:hypothetical protein